MKKIFVRKIFPYDPTLNGKLSKFEGYRLITSGKANPGASQILNIRLPVKIRNPLLCSTLKRGEETAKSISDSLKVQVNPTHDLDEIKFNLGKLLTRKEYEEYGSNLVRQRFIEFFIKDRLGEKRELIKKRIVSLISKLEELPDGNYLLISHSFFMKILKIYLKNNELFDKPEVLSEKFDYRKKTFDFGEGFEFKI